MNAGRAAVFPNRDSREGWAGSVVFAALAEMRRPLIALELASLFQLVVVVVPRQDFHPLLEAPLNLPGVRLRLFPSGVSYLSQVANNILAEQLPRINIPNVEHRLPGDQGAIFISRIKISRFRRAEIQDVTTSAPNRISWIMKNLDLGFIGDLSGAVNIVVPFNLTGQAEVQAEGLSVQLDSAMERGPNGSAHISSIACHSTIRAVDVVNHNGGLFGLAVTVFKQGVSDNVRLMLQGLICKKVRKYLDEDLNEKLAEVQTRSPLSEAIETNAIRATKLSKAVGGATLGSLLGKSISKEFYIDFRLREDPFCGTNMVDLACAGEISYKGLGGTPFGPPPIAWLRTQSDTHMLMLQISDYLPNSLFYHAHKQRLIRLHLSPSSPGVSQFLQTSCENSFCIADLVPQLAETYPNHTLELSLASTRAPAVLFSEKKGGVISVSLGGVVVVFVFDGVRRKQAAVLDVEIVADAKLNLQDRTVSGSVQLTKFELSSRSGTVKISRDELSDISILVSQMIENMLNEMLTNGFPLPLPHVIRLQNVALEVLNRRILIRTDITVDERRLSQLAEKTLFNGPQFGRQFVRENTLRTFKRMASH
ncbi:hypothetical protein V3C99_008976 [Haemonchus contortus]